MVWNVPVADMKQVLRLISTYALVTALFPVFLILAVLYMCIHPNRAAANAEENPAGELLPTH
jgi:hypothetical protein